MFNLAVFCSLAFIGGAVFGRFLAATGINSDNALENYQKPLVWGLAAIAFVLTILIAIDKFNLISLLPKIFPPVFLIYLAGYFNETILGMGFFCLGLLVFLELAGKRSRQGIRQLIVAIATISLALSILLFFLRPVAAFVNGSIIINDIVMQTTPYTCAPASIATIARYTQKHPDITEKEVVKLTKTNRFGTTTLLEIKAMHQLGLNPQYRHNLSLQDLIELNKPALLHVKEKNKTRKGVRFSHAVAFLAIDKERKLLAIGNPLYGLQVKPFENMDEYWFGEAILANSDR